MGRYTAIADVGQALVRILQENLCPEPLMNPDSISLCAPPDRGDTVVGLYLYDVGESEAVRATTPIAIGENQLRSPPMLLQLSYLLTVYSAAEAKFRAMDEQRILGRAMQVMSDNAALDAMEVLKDPNGIYGKINIQLMNLTMEEKMRIWSFPEVPYRLSACYQVAPVEVESTRLRTVRRVVDVQMGAKE